MAIGPRMCSDVISGRAKEELPAQLLVPPNMGRLLHSAGWNSNNFPNTTQSSAVFLFLSAACQHSSLEN